MENAAEALKIAFALFAFVLAITVTFSLISQAKSTSDYVLFYSDKTNFYDNLNSLEENREVSLSEVICSLYRYSKEVAVTVKIDHNTYTFDLNVQEYIALEGESKINKYNREENLARFIEKELIGKLSDDAKFTEEFIEVPIDGIYKFGDDDTEITITPGGKKVYITYILQK